MSPALWGNMPTLKELRRISPAEKVFSRPSWSDPTFNLLTSQWVVSEFTLAAATVLQAVSADPKRWGLVFVRISGGVSPIRVSPSPNPTRHGFDITSSVLDRRFTIFEYGPMVQSEWYAICAQVAEVAFYTLTIL